MRGGAISAYRMGPFLNSEIKRLTVAKRRAACFKPVESERPERIGRHFRGAIILAVELLGEDCGVPFTLYGRGGVF